MRKIKAVFEITRPSNLIITFAVVYVSAIICTGFFRFSSNIIIASISALLVAASGNIINDIFDFEIDKINRPNRVIPSGRLSKNEALVIYSLFTIIALFLAILISFEAIFIVLITSILLFFYSYIFKGIPLIGNLIVALCTAMAFLYGGIVVGNIKAALIPALFAFLVNLIREIIKDVEDIEGDKKNQLSTLPIKFGLLYTKNILLILAIILILSTVYPFIMKIYKIEYFLIVLFFVDLPLIYLLKKIYSKEFLTNLSQLSFSIKLIMIFGLIAIYLGQF